MDILVSHSIKFDQRTFELNKVKAYVNDKVKYIGSINSIITDKPSILANDLFLRRANCVMDNMNPNDKGELKEESEGEFAGKKIFEIDVNGDIGLDPEHLSITNMKGMMAAVITLIFLLGALIFLNDTKDSIKKNSYF